MKRREETARKYTARVCTNKLTANKMLKSSEKEGKFLEKTKNFEKIDRY